jgi:hypothetical protein
MKIGDPRGAPSKNRENQKFWRDFRAKTWFFLQKIIDCACGAVTLVEGRVFWHVF